MPAEGDIKMRVFIISLLAGVALVSSKAQTPMPVIVPAMTPAVSAKPGVVADSASSPAQAALKTLQAMKAVNDEILKQQAATLLKLDEMEKAANEIRIYSKRG